MGIAPPSPPVNDPAGFSEYLRETASRDPVGRLIVEVFRNGSNARMSAVAQTLNFSDAEFGRAVAEAEWGSLIKREERTDGVYLVLTPQGQARSEAILRLTSQRNSQLLA